MTTVGPMVHPDMFSFPGCRGPPASNALCVQTPPPPPPTHTHWSSLHGGFTTTSVSINRASRAAYQLPHTHTLGQPHLRVYHHVSFYTLCVQTHSSLYSLLSVSIHFVYKLTASCTAYHQFPYTLCTNSQHPVQHTISFDTLCVQTHSILYSLSSVSIHFVYKLTASCTAYQLPHTHTLRLGMGGEGSTTIPVSIHFV